MSEQWGPIEPIRPAAGGGEFGNIEPAPSTAEAAVRGVAQGLTADWSDEAAGALDYLKAALSPKGASRADYEKGRNESRRANEDARKAHPTAYGAGHIAGDLGLGAAAMGVAGPVAGAALLGGANAAGASTSSDPMELAKGAAKGAAVGAVAGKVGQMGFGLLGKLASKSAPAAAKLSDGLTAQALGAAEGTEAAAVLQKMAQGGRPGSLTERAGRLGLLDSISWAGRREAAVVAQENVAKETRAVMQALDGHPSIDPPDIKSLFAGVVTNPKIQGLVNDPMQGMANSEVAHEFLAPLASTEGWAGRHAALEALREDVRPTLEKMAAGRAVSPADEVKATAYRAARGVFSKEAQDAAERGGQELLGSQLASLNKDEALAGLASRLTTDKASTKTVYDKLSAMSKLAGVGQIAAGHPVSGALTLLGGSKAAQNMATPYAAKAAGAIGKLGGAGSQMGKVGRLVATSGDDVAARVLGEKQGKDDLSVAAAHMVAQQSSPSYQKKAGDLAKRLSKEKPK